MQTSHFLPRTIARQVSSTGRRRLLPGVIPAPPLSLCHYDQPSRPYSSPSKPSSASRPSSPWTSATGSDLGNTANRTTAAGASGGVGGGGDTKYERVGPFPVGAGLGENVRTKKWAPWKDLDVGGKVVRMTAQTGNLAVVLVGGTLFVLMTIALTTELFSPNSPTVLLNEAIDMVEDSELMDHHLLRPYSFTHLPSSTSSRRSSPVQSQLVVHPQTGNEHLVLRFWVHGRGRDEPDTLVGWTKARWREGKVWVKQAVREMGSDTRGVPIGSDPQSSSSSSQGESADEVSATTDRQSAGPSTGWFSSLFGALIPSTSRPLNSTYSTPKAHLAVPGTYTSGEGRADFFKDPESDTFKLLVLTVDVPGGGRNAAQRAVLYWADPSLVASESMLEGSNYKITF